MTKGTISAINIQGHLFDPNASVKTSVFIGFGFNFMIFAPSEAIVDCLYM